MRLAIREHVFRVSNSGGRSVCDSRLIVGHFKAIPTSHCFHSGGICLKAIDADLCINMPRLCVDEISQIAPVIVVLIPFHQLLGQRCPLVKSRL